MQTWKLLIEYDGTQYHGWQEQPNAKSVAGAIRAAIEDSFQAPIELMAAGRTDSGVHALGQVAHCRLQYANGPGVRVAKLPPQHLLYEWNDRLPSDIVILDAAPAPNHFHARHDAISRSYLYQISTRKSAFSKRHVWWVKDELDLAAMQSAVALLEGRHDFAQFTALQNAPAERWEGRGERQGYERQGYGRQGYGRERGRENYSRQGYAGRPREARGEEAGPWSDGPAEGRGGHATEIAIERASIEREGPLLVFRITASHFLWKMVRRLVGVLVMVGRGEVSTAQMARLLEGQADPRCDVAAWTAPPSGLFLEEIRYETREGKQRAPRRL